MVNEKAPPLKPSSAAFLQAVIVLVGIGALALLLWEPHLEGRNAHATAFEVYLKDPFLAYVYFASISFFVALYHAFKVLGYSRQDKIFSQAAVKSLRTIKYCAIALIGFVAIAEVIILLHTSDDHAGGVFMGILITVGCVVVVAAAATFERILQNAVDLKSENELTV
jgi:cytochrome bd-type quinol oxidase subunit 2